MEITSGWNTFVVVNVVVGIVVAGVVVIVVGVVVGVVVLGVVVVVVVVVVDVVVVGVFVVVCSLAFYFVRGWHGGICVWI
jgi:hypothetical protein